MICRSINQAGEATSCCSIKVVGESSRYIDSRSLYPASTLDRLEEFEVVTMGTRKAPDGEATTISTTMVSPPYFTSHIRSTEVVEGESVTFECTTSMEEEEGDPSVGVEVLHNGGQPGARTEGRMEVIHERSSVQIRLKEARVTDEGIYSVRLSSTGGASISSASLRVVPREFVAEQQEPSTTTFHGPPGVVRQQMGFTKTVTTRTEATAITFPPPTFLRPLHSAFTASEGDEVMLECAVAPFNDPTLKVEWFVNGQPLSSSSRISTLTSLGAVRLYIKDLAPKDSGVYKCR